MKLSLIDLSHIQTKNVDLVNEAFELWEETFEPILKSAGERISADLFFRAKLLSVIHKDSFVISTALHNLLDLRVRGFSGIGYFNEMPKNLLSAFCADGMRLFSVEWVNVHPEYRLKMTKVQQADLIMGSSIRAMAASAFDAVIGYSRIDLGADRMAANFGAKPLEKVTAHGIECNVMLVKKEWFKPHRFSIVEAACDELWKNKENHTSVILNEPIGEFYEKRVEFIDRESVQSS